MEVQSSGVTLGSGMYLVSQLSFVCSSTTAKIAIFQAAGKKAALDLIVHCVTET